MRQRQRSPIVPDGVFDEPRLANVYDALDPPDRPGNEHVFVARSRSATMPS